MLHRMLAVLVCIVALACKSPLAGLRTGGGEPSLHLASVTVEDHSRQLKRLRRMSPSEPNSPEARRAALDGHGHWLEAAFRTEAEACGIRTMPGAPYQLELLVTDLGEIQTRYILYGIASGVLWGVGTGLLAHNSHLAWGLGVYELLEESAFWIGGSSLFGSFSAPAVVKARLYRTGKDAACWAETYCALSGRSLIEDLSDEQRSDRSIQLRASLQVVVLKILEDLETIPGFPRGTRERLALLSTGGKLGDLLLMP